MICLYYVYYLFANTILQIMDQTINNNFDNVDDTDNVDNVDNADNVDNGLDQIDRENNEHYDRKNSGKKNNKTTRHPNYTSEIYFKVKRIDNPKESDKYYCTELDEELESYRQIFDGMEINSYSNWYSNSNSNREIIYDKTKFDNKKITEILETHKKEKRTNYIKRSQETTLTYVLPVTHIVWINKSNTYSKQYVDELKETELERMKSCKLDIVSYTVTYRDTYEAIDNSYNGRYSPTYNWSKDPRPKGSGKRQIKKDMRYGHS